MQNTNWFKSIKAKLIFLSFVPSLILGITAIVSYNGINKQSLEIDRANNVRVPKAEYLGEMDSARNAIMRWLWVSWDEPLNSMDSRSKSIDKITNELKRFNESFSKYLAYDRNESEKKSFGTVEKLWPDVEADIKEAIKNLKLGTELGNKTAHDLVAVNIHKGITPIREAFNDLRDQQHVRITDAIKRGRDLQEDIKMTTVTLSIIGFIFSMLFSIFLASQLSSKLAQITEKIFQASQYVNSASFQLSTASQQLSSGATESASSLEETVSSLEELSSMVKLNTDHAREAASLSQDGRKSAEEGDHEMKELSLAMGEISASSKKIEEIISVIDDIAFQTNILALNAAVEAARAGEQGKGFAVVAEAVRSLAQQSAGAAKQISTLIKDSVHKIEHGSVITQKSNEALTKIVTSIKKISELNKEIASAGQEQATGLSQISKAMNQMDQASQGNAASSEEVAASAEEMANQSTTMMDLVGNLNAIIYGSTQNTVSSSDVQSSRSHAKNQSKGNFNSNAAILKFTNKKNKFSEKSGSSVVHHQSEASDTLTSNVA